MTDAKRGALTSAQIAVCELLSSTWESLSSPTVVVLDAPTGRGKTRIIQNFYDSQVDGQPEGARFWQGKLAGDDLNSWRKARKTVVSNSVDVTQRPNLLWFGIDGYPLVKSDLLGEVQKLNRAIIDGYESGTLPISDPNPLRRGPGRGVPWELVKAATDIVANCIPGASFARTGIGATIAIGRAAARRDEFGLPLSIDDPEHIALAILLTSFATSVIGELENALSPILLAIDDAHLLEPTTVAALNAVMKSNPDAQLLGSGLLRGRQREFAAMRGMPPVPPVMLVATRQPVPDSRPDYFAARVKAWTKAGFTVVTIGDDRLPLVSEAESIDIAAHRLTGLGLTEDQLRLVAEHAHDRLLKGVNASLLVAHCERVWRLIEPSVTLTPAWAEQHLPRFIEEDARERYDKLPLRAQQAVVAGSLRGPAFAQSSVSTLLPQLSATDNWVGEIDDSGYAQHASTIDGDKQLVFSDEPAFAYARKLAVRDSYLCTCALTGISAPFLKELWASATVESYGRGMICYEISRQESYQYEELVQEAELRSQDLDAETWAAVLGFGAERRFAIEEMIQSNQRGQMRQLWGDLVSGKEPLEGDGWSIAARWVVHRHLPGPMTFGGARVAPVPTRTWLTRFHPQAPRIAAGVAGRVLPYLVANSRVLLEPGLRLLLRLGFGGRLLSSGLRRSVASHLLQVAPWRLSAAVLLARVYRRDLDRFQRDSLYRIIRDGSIPDSANWRPRQALGLMWLGHELPKQEISQTIDDLVNACRSEPHIYEEDAFGIAGKMIDVSDPLVYPWAHQTIYAAASLLTAPVQIPVPSPAREVARDTLMAALDTHPGAAWLLSSGGAVGLTADQKHQVRTALHEWQVRGALDAGRFDLTGLIEGQPHNVKKKNRKR
jgi:hypothetical protein